MAKLEKGIQEKIGKLLDESNALYNEEKLADSLEVLYKAWDLLPEPKYDYDESYTIVWGVLDTAIKLDDRDTMNAWLDRIFLANPSRVDSGEREMWAGRVNYAMEKFKEAYDYFEIANKKSLGRCFWPSDKIYKEFFLNYKKD